ncbi:MAG: hypothetical protein VX068_03290, partial [Candidatus Thermoplasmatota archaeon]|nr:hypothetical protein [Candidatus Thermoplasmatota archaeon]
MEARRVSALFLVAVMALAGCLGATEPAPDIEEEAPDSYELKTTWIVAPTTVQLGEEASFTLGIQQIGQGEWTVGYEVLRPDFSPVEDVQWVENDVGLELAFTPTLTGEHVISITIVNAGTSTLTPPVESMVLSLTVTPPDEPAPILTTPSRLVLEEPNVVWFEGSVDHPFHDSCTVTYTISDGNDGSIALNADGAWKILVDFTEATESHTITTLANCGRFATASDTSATQVIIEGAGDDQDGDGVQDANDRCPTGIGADDGWQSTMATDGDQDGCRDNDEDEDDDNDGIVDTYDLCP